MPYMPLPLAYNRTPNRYLLQRGSCLWRVHSQKYRAQAFKDIQSDPLFGGGRFDSTSADPYLFCYAALDETTAVAEVLLRDPPWTQEGDRQLNRTEVTGRQLSGLTLTRDLKLVSLITGQDLAAVAQDHWLVTADGPQYAQTRGWAQWLRKEAPWAQGFIWPSLRDPGGRAVILFGDRCAASFGPDYQDTLLQEVVGLRVKLDDYKGALWLNRHLEPYYTAVAYPQ